MPCMLATACSQLQLRRLATAARLDSAATEVDGSTDAGAPRGPPPSDKPLAPKTRQLLAREQLVASFAAQLTGSQPDQEVPVDWVEAAPTSEASLSLRSQALELQEKRENRWKRRPLEYPKHEVRRVVAGGWLLSKQGSWA